MRLEWLRPLKYNNEDTSSQEGIPVSVQHGLAWREVQVAAAAARPKHKWRISAKEIKVYRPQCSSLKGLRVFYSCIQQSQPTQLYSCTVQIRYCTHMDMGVQVSITKMWSPSFMNNFTRACHPPSLPEGGGCVYAPLWHSTPWQHAVSVGPPKSQPSRNQSFVYGYDSLVQYKSFFPSCHVSLPLTERLLPIHNHIQMSNSLHVWPRE